MEAEVQKEASREKIYDLLEKPGVEFLVGFALLFFSWFGALLCVSIPCFLPEQKERYRPVFNIVFGNIFFSFAMIIITTSIFLLSSQVAILSPGVSKVFQGLSSLVWILWLLPSLTMIFNYLRVKKGRSPFRFPLLGLDTIVYNKTFELLEKEG